MDSFPPGTASGGRRSPVADAARPSDPRQSCTRVAVAVAFVVVAARCVRQERKGGDPKNQKKEGSGLRACVPGGLYVAQPPPRVPRPGVACKQLSALQIPSRIAASKLLVLLGGRQPDAFFSFLSSPLALSLPTSPHLMPAPTLIRCG
uniref:Uncharacterized protein n=1 Tax=Oryza punctata TaxID=4537 RepID=A0A0E0JPD9_ORYPU